jgi:archaellum component FlaC
MSDDIKKIKKDVADIKKQIHELNNKLDGHIERIWAVYNHLQKPIETVKNLFGGNKK